MGYLQNNFYPITYQIVKEALDHNNIEYWLDAGSLLGAYRDGKMIPHDLDIDFAVFEEEGLNKAGNVLESIVPEGYTMRLVIFCFDDKLLIKNYSFCSNTTETKQAKYTVPVKGPAGASFTHKLICDCVHVCILVFN